MEDYRRIDLKMDFGTAFKVGIGLALGGLAVWGVFLGIIVAVITAIGISLFA